MMIRSELKSPVRWSNGWGPLQTGLRAAAMDPEAVLSQYADHQFIHLVPSLDFEEQKQFRQGAQAAEMIDYFSANFSSQNGRQHE